ncbi:MAG: AraC family transcriptional regulator [Candidatus Thiodiazotropha sp. (ex Monitilora ramsayi)]|nr:AraC family transcriptional regulator [Candidatus Thiodiazotropha sp. (ex Monitilora ramsayi)]
MDSLSAILSTFRLQVEIIHNAQYCGNWAVDTSGPGHISFHLVTHGHCYAESPKLTSPARLETGDFIMFPQRTRHTVSSERDCAIEVNIAQSHPYEEGLQHNGVGLLCGYFRFTHAANSPLLDILPPVKIVQSSIAKADSLSANILSLIRQEALAQASGYQTSINRLAESLFVVLAREHMEEGEAISGLAAALSDGRISKALDAIHAKPEGNWTVEELAGLAHMSRSAFAERFKSLLDESPISYLGRWRMQNAWLWLSEERASIYDVARRCGYESEASFSKAFKKYMGESPGKVRNLDKAPAGSADNSIKMSTTQSKTV